MGPGSIAIIAKGERIKLTSVPKISVPKTLQYSPIEETRGTMAFAKIVLMPVEVATVPTLRKQPMVNQLSQLMDLTVSPSANDTPGKK